MLGNDQRTNRDFEVPLIGKQQIRGQEAYSVLLGGGCLEGFCAWTTVGRGDERTWAWSARPA
jgi:hypothetical protein